MTGMDIHVLEHIRLELAVCGDEIAQFQHPFSQVMRHAHQYQFAAIQNLAARMIPQPMNQLLDTFIFTMVFVFSH